MPLRLLSRVVAYVCASDRCYYQLPLLSLSSIIQRQIVWMKCIAQVAVTSFGPPSLQDGSVCDSKSYCSLKLRGTSNKLLSWFYCCCSASSHWWNTAIGWSLCSSLPDSEFDWIWHLIRQLHLWILFLVSFFHPAVGEGTASASVVYGWTSVRVRTCYSCGAHQNTRSRWAQLRASLPWSV